MCWWMGCAHRRFGAVATYVRLASARQQWHVACPLLPPLLRPPYGRRPVSTCSHRTWSTRSTRRWSEGSGSWRKTSSQSSDRCVACTMYSMNSSIFISTGLEPLPMNLILVTENTRRNKSMTRAGAHVGECYLPVRSSPPLPLATSRALATAHHSLSTQLDTTEPNGKMDTHVTDAVSLSSMPATASFSSTTPLTRWHSRASCASRKVTTVA